MTYNVSTIILKSECKHVLLEQKLKTIIYCLYFLDFSYLYMCVLCVWVKVLLMGFNVLESRLESSSKHGSDVSRMTSVSVRLFVCVCVCRSEPRSW